MKKILILATMMLLFMNGSLIAMTPTQQTAEETKKELTKEQKKQLQAALDSLLHKEALEAVESKAFTLEADQVTFKYGQVAYVTPNTNFVCVNGDEATLQTAFNIPISGFNGLGGITVDGTLSNFKTEHLKDGDATVSMQVMGTGVSATVFIRLYKDSNKATVSIMPNFSSNNISLTGYIVPLQKSNVFKGRSL